MLNDLLSAFERATQAGATPAREVVREYTKPADNGLHQFTVFLKPEATDAPAGVKVDKVCELLLERLEAFNVEVGAALVLNGPYLAKAQIMDNHYGVINSISKGGRAAISDGAEAKLKEGFSDLLEAGCPVLGGHEFIERNPEFSALALSTINDNIGTSKLAGGTYALKLDLFGLPQLILNPFHPYQLVPFNAPGSAVIVLEGLSKTPWAELRSKLVGTTNPATAEAGSIRQQFLEHQESLGLVAVNQGANGVHLSAGPLEGMVELQRFFSNHDAGDAINWGDTAFGGLLIDQGAEASKVADLATNPEINGESAFDLTEEIDAAESASRLLG